MASRAINTGYDTLQYEIAQERASALGRLGRRLEAALEALAACPPTDGPDRAVSDGLLAEAGYALWLLVVQRESCGLDANARAMRAYGVPHEVYVRMGPARPGLKPAKTTGSR